MTVQYRSLPGAACLLLAALAVSPMASTPARAQADLMGGIGQSETITAHATVKAVDQKARVVTLVGERGRTMTLKIGDEVQNLAQVRPGNRVTVVYHASVTYVLAPPSVQRPDNSMTVAGARATPGEMPAGAVGSRIVLTRTVTAVDPAAHTISVVDPSGGEVHTLNVTSAQGQQALPSVKLGDNITAILTEAVAVAVTPAK
jgi:hypothetical protein